MSEGYTRDHIAVIKVLGREIPKRPALSTQEVCKLGFKDKGDKADRIVRNAYRKLRDKEMVEICDRGMYRLTPAGAAFAKQIKEKGADAFVQERKKGERKPKAKKAAKKAAKPAAKKAAKKAAKPAVKAKPKAKPAPKKAAPKAKPAPKAESKPTNGKGALSKLRGAAPKKAETKGNAEPPKPKAEEKPATLPM